MLLFVGYEAASKWNWWGSCSTSYSETTRSSHKVERGTCKDATVSIGSLFDSLHGSSLLLMKKNTSNFNHSRLMIMINIKGTLVHGERICWKISSFLKQLKKNKCVNSMQHALGTGPFDRLWFEFLHYEILYHIRTSQDWDDNFGPGGCDSNVIVKRTLKLTLIVAMGHVLMLEQSNWSVAKQIDSYSRASVRTNSSINFWNGPSWRLSYFYPLTVYVKIAYKLWKNNFKDFIIAWKTFKDGAWMP